ncbi:hypothetical protein ACFQXB_11705 [Plastorhodobacter daqingensis]|uniref:HTH cro/C1-type domain-containing protein n=1 Tax=Plastorhodobacter daqingensis TaxID=1387281 RepID=A0ABW2UMU2_9RHOB
MTIKLKHPDFFRRLQQACEANPLVPPKHSGQLVWLADQIRKRGKTSPSVESVRKWMSGETMPRHDAMLGLAEILGVDANWLAFGTGEVSTKHQAVSRSRNASGAVNVVAGIAQMSGGSVAFPKEGEKAAEQDKVSLYVYMDGAHYRITVIPSEDVEGKLTFHVPVECLISDEPPLIIGINPLEDFRFELYRITPDMLEAGTRKGAFVVVELNPNWKKMKGFLK